MPQPLHDYPPELLETCLVVLHSLPQQRLISDTLHRALVQTYLADADAAGHPLPLPPLGPFMDDLCALYAAHVTPRAGPVRRERPRQERQYFRAKLIALVERALDDQRGISRAPDDNAPVAER